MAHLYLSPETDSLYLDVSSGDRSPVRMAAVAEGVYLHVDEKGELVAVEVMDLRKRGGLQVDDLDDPDGERRPAVFDVIEKRAAEGALRPRPEARNRAQEPG